MASKPVNEKRNKELYESMKRLGRENNERKNGKLKTQNKMAGIDPSMSKITINMDWVNLFHKR